MPRPNNNLIPDRNRWTFLQRFPNDAELNSLAVNLNTYSLRSYGRHKSDILSFLGLSPTESEKAWSDYWVSIIQFLGLGYTTSLDNLIHTTNLAKFLADNPTQIQPFYLYWALRFQFPWAQNKHADWKEHLKVIQPFVLILEYLVTLWETSNGNMEDVYLSYEEVITIVMASNRETIYDVKANVSKILNNRQTGFDYDSLKVDGYDIVEKQFDTRTRLFFEHVNIISFDRRSQRVVFGNFKSLVKACNFLAFSKPAYIITNEHERINYFENAFMSLDPRPLDLFSAVEVATLPLVTTHTFSNLHTEISKGLAAEGYNFEESFIEAFLLSLKSKPFLILSGISGTGKTSLPKAIMKLVGNECNPIAVSPDWTDNSDMLGYFNLDEEFIIGEFTHIVLEASKNLHQPYYVILDEMNLARVEYYFAQVLSSIESRVFDPVSNKVIYQDFIFNSAIRKRLLSKGETDLANLKLRENIYIIGTVNIDETTHPFSKKVLDRANVLEIDEVNLFSGLHGLLTDSSSSGSSPIPNSNFLFKGTVTNLAELVKEWRLNTAISSVLALDSTLPMWIQLLEDFNKVLTPLKMNFAFRLRDEVCIYLYYSAILNVDTISTKEEWWHSYFDQQIVQKILTRLSGEQGQIESYLVQLFNLCSVGRTYNENDICELDLEDLITNEPDAIRFKLAAKKLKKMLNEVVIYEKPSTSFWTA